jgi:DNA helicase-2/ATP-dependent DNA helicase PcrA
MQPLLENPKSLVDEKEIQSTINKAVDTTEHFVFDAGAGSGKTYALIETLKYIIKQHGKKLSKNNKNILCITYTNAAADNVKSSFGNSDIVKVSTIHERVWELIFLHQDALLIEHEIKIKLTLAGLNESFKGGPEDVWLNSGDKVKFDEYFLREDVKTIFYNSDDISTDFESVLGEFGYILYRNLEKFKKAIKYLYGTSRLYRCLEDMELGKKKKVKYNANFNSDRLHYMTISHDTLLEYGLALCKKYPMLRRIIIDSYPYILIDEYQDTNIHVVQLMYELAKDSGQPKRLLIGYFGDQMQSIYSDGVSNRLNEYHPGLLRIEKKYNRRSRNEIIDVSNSLRNDGLKQKSVFSNNVGGSFSFHQLVSLRPDDSSKLVNEFIKCELSPLNEDEVHCLVLKNEMLAELSGFKELFVNFKVFFFFEEQSQKLISKDLNKLDGTIRIIFGLIYFRELISKRQKTLEDILPKLKIPISMFDAKNYITELNVLVSDEVKTFKDFLIAMFHLYKDGSSIFKNKINEFFPLNEFEYSFDGFCRFLNAELSRGGSIKEEDRVERIKKIVSLDLAVYIKWYEFVSDSSCELVKFHTYHSTKGLEYKNVVIIMENSFSRNKEYFPEFFKVPNNIEFQERRNLLYVACSRAVCNLRILYLDSILSFKDEIESFFGEAKDFSVTDNNQNNQSSGTTSDLFPKCTTQDLVPKRFCELEHLKSMWSSKIRRKQKLIVPVSRFNDESEFLSGEDWFFNVHFAFRSALDINYIERKKDKKSYMVWIQGPILKFKEGDMLHSSDGTTILQVKNANPMGWDSSLGSMYEGTVLFEVYENINNKIRKLKSYTCTQMVFLEILITGEFDESKISIH